MIDLLRSVVWGEDKEEKSALGNLTKVQPDRLLSLKPAEAILVAAVLEFHTKYAKAPSMRTLRDFADDLKNPDVTKVVDDVEMSTFYQGVDFEELFEREVKTQGITEMTSVCKEAVNFVTSGKKTLEEAIAHLYTVLRVPAPKVGDKLPSSLKKAAPMLEKLYHNRKSKPTQSYGIFTGYGVLDQSTAGIKKKQFYLHAAFPGHLKSTMIQNMMINAAVDYGWNPILFTAEMPADDVMLNLVAIHSGHKMFKNAGYKPLSSFKLKMGTLDSKEEEIYKLVQDDLVSNPDYGTIRVVDSAEFTTLGSIIQRTIKEHSILEVDQVWIDYLTRLPVDQKNGRMQLTEARNESLTDAKRFAMSFDGGRGLAVCSAFQTNRDSYKRIKEREGKTDKKTGNPLPAGTYDMTCLGQYNNAEKEADVITYTWYDEEERKNQEPKLGILKSRWGDTPPGLVSLFIERDCRRIADMTQGMVLSSTPTMAPGGGTEDVTL